MPPKIIHISYYALLREKRGVSQETVTTQAQTVLDLYQELIEKHKFSLNSNLLKVAINDEVCSWEAELGGGDRVIFIPPVAGG